MATTDVATQRRFASPMLAFGTAIFLSAWLLFQVQPMFAKMALPLLGGAPGVWNTALVFFQAVLLLGYLYAHFLGTRLPFKLQVIVHLVVLAVAFIALPVAIGDAWRDPPEGTPVGWLIALLGASVGLPFFALSATSPLLQRWFGETGHESARDPYFLYGASNLGSLMALLAYPLLIEPNLVIADQSLFWTLGYVLLALAIGACGCIAFYFIRRVRPASGEAQADRGIARAAGPVLGAPTLKLRLHWVALAFVPSGLLVAVTTLMTTDLVAIPLLWVLPLTLYLLSFVFVFARRQILPLRTMILLQAPLLIITALIATWNLSKYLYPIIGLVLLTLFVTSMVCHGRLAESRPPARHLTEFYVWMSLGGILGSAFAALLTPLVFDHVIELPLLCAAAAFLRPRTDRTDEKREAHLLISASAVLRDISFPVAALSLIVTLAPRLEAEGGATKMLLLALLMLFAIVFTMLSAGRPLRFGLCVAAVAMFGIQFSASSSTTVVHRERTFFGTHILKRDSVPGYLVFVHGNTVHGAQHESPGRRRERQTYYHPGTGLGRVFEALGASNRLPRQVGAIGLGAGEIACYRTEGQAWTFFEIDPAVARIAASGAWFRFLPECTPDARIVIGDGRLTLAREPAAKFDMLVLDAFSSDSIPTHLVTREAFKLYFEKLSQRGVLLVHISNRYLDLEPAIAALSADMKIAARVFDTDAAKMSAEYPVRYKATWIALARDEADLKSLTEAHDKATPSAWGQWRALTARPGFRVWTDDYSNIISIVR